MYGDLAVYANNLARSHDRSYGKFIKLHRDSFFMTKNKPSNGKKEIKISKNVPVRIARATNSIEEETIDRAGQTIEAIDTFLNKWDASPIKPEGLRSHATKMLMFRQALDNWRKNSMRVIRSSEERGNTLQEFIRICHQYA